MSIFGTGVIAGVAQSHVQAQQVNRQQKRNQTETADDARRLRELAEAHFQALDEGDENESTTQLRIDGQLPEHEKGGAHQSNLQPRNRPDEPDAAVADESTPGADPEAGDRRESLYRHVDLTA